MHGNGTREGCVTALVSCMRAPEHSSRQNTIILRHITRLNNSGLARVIVSVSYVEPCTGAGSRRADSSPGVLVLNLQSFTEAELKDAACPSSILLCIYFSGNFTLSCGLYEERTCVVTTRMAAVAECNVASMVKHLRHNRICYASCYRIRNW